jgi:hypothetical protein
VEQTSSSVAIVTATAPTAASSPPPALSSAPPAAAIFLRPRFIDDQSATEELLTVKGRDHSFRFGVIANLGKAEAARLARKAISEQGERIRLDAEFGE